MRLVAKFSKEDRVKYISHLDMMRTFQRAIRRATLPVAFTQGFSPHPKMAFASALPVGLSSEGEYLDIIMESDIEPAEFDSRLNSALPSGIKIIQSVKIDPKHPSLMSIIERASYRIFMPFIMEKLAECTEAFLSQPYVLVAREKSDSLQYINIRPLIHWVKLSVNDCSGQALDVMFNSGSKSNLKPQIFADALLDFLKGDREILYHRIHRLDMYFFRNEKLVTPLDLVEFISI